jgi:hypothetical protein
MTAMLLTGDVLIAQTVAPKGWQRACRSGEQIVKTCAPARRVLHQV